MTTAPMEQQVLSLFLQGPVVLFQWRNLTRWPMEYVSPNCEQVLGYTAEELLSGHLAYADLVHPEDIEQVEREFAAYGARGYFYHSPYRLMRKSGVCIWVSDHTRSLTEQGNVTRYLGYVMNISKQIEQQQQLQAAIRILTAGGKQELALKRKTEKLRHVGKAAD